MKDLIVGSTGFVGGNLLNSHPFEGFCHSTNVKKYYGSEPELCVYAGVPAAMFLANSNPDADLEIMRQARENVRCINPKRLVLISSVAVYSNNKGKDETDEPNQGNLSAYGANRLQLEKWVREDYPDSLIVRLPALYGIGLKKNFLYDLHTIVPAMLTKTKYLELSNIECVKNGYTEKNEKFMALNGYYASELKEFFENNDFNALSFTDSRSIYQFYSLSHLWNDIELCLKYNLKLVNLCTPPVSAMEVYEYLNKKSWQNYLNKEPFNYDLHSCYSELLGGEGYYLCSKEEELKEIALFMENWK